MRSGRAMHAPPDGSQVASIGRLRPQARKLGFSIRTKRASTVSGPRTFSLIDRETGQVVEGNLRHADDVQDRLKEFAQNGRDASPPRRLATVPQRSCPVCGTPRTGSFRLCSSCGHDYSAGPTLTAGIAASAVVQNPEADRESIVARLIKLAVDIRGRPYGPLLTSVLVGISVFVATFALRAVFLARSYDIFVDEVTYYRLGSNLIDGQGLTLFGVPFFLHPPAFLVFESLFLAVVRPAGDLVQQVLATRMFNVILAGVSAVAIFGIVSRTAGRNLGLAAAAVFMLEPFINKVNSRLLLETGVLLWVLLGYFVLLRAGVPGRTRVDPAIGLPGLWGRFTRGRTHLDALVGILFGLAVLSKDMAAFLTLLPMGICVASGRFLERRRAALIGAVAVGTYALYPIAVALLGLGPEFVAQKFRGLLRFVGVVRETGFDRGGEGPSFLSAVLANLDAFALTYTLIAIGVPAVIVLLRWGGPPQRLIGLWTACSYVLLGYSITLGTLEEHFFYLLVVPAIIATATAWPIVLYAAERHLFSLRVRVGAVERVLDTAMGLLPRVGVLVIIATLGWSGVIWVQVHSTSDDSYARLITYMESKVPEGRALGVTHPLEHFIFQGYVLEPIISVAEIDQKRLDYFVISTKQVEQGYTENGAAIANWLRLNAVLETAYTGRSYGSLELWKIQRPAAGSHGSVIVALLDPDPAPP